MADLRIGIVGCGFIGTVHSFALKALTDSHLAAAAVTHVCDADPAKASAAAGVHGAAVAADVETLVDEVDVVWVCAPTSVHLAIVEAAAAAGRAVYCEKPLGRDLAEATAVATALQSVPHRVGLVLRSAPVFAALRAETMSGSHGRAMTAVFRDDQWFPVGGMYGSTWRSDAVMAGAGTLLEHSIHDVDLLRWLLGEPEWVAARTANFAGHEGVEDLAVVTLGLAGGATATLASVWHRVSTRPSTRRLEVFCQDALLWLDDDNLGPLHVETSAGASVVDCPPPAWSDAWELPDEIRRPLALYATPAKEFLDDVASGAVPRGPDSTDALAAHRVVDAAYRSAAEGGSPVLP
ncbi:MAG: Gfo/Idh/MocA family oxidoreductase [Actinobacteria bacterium]|nr:Gfo/Idh/MocA family oxidoreductase [Actinomycetota bacterium]